MTAMNWKLWLEMRPGPAKTKTTAHHRKGKEEISQSVLEPKKAR